jgi:hypothetical protein
VVLVVPEIGCGKSVVKSMISFPFEHILVCCGLLFTVMERFISLSTFGMTWSEGSVQLTIFYHCLLLQSTIGRSRFTGGRLVRCMVSSSGLRNDYAESNFIGHTA